MVWGLGKEQKDVNDYKTQGDVVPLIWPEKGKSSDPCLGDGKGVRCTLREKQEAAQKRREEKQPR